jgi:hypothetical protein
MGCSGDRCDFYRHAVRPHGAGATDIGPRGLRSTPVAIVTNTGCAAGQPGAQRLFDLAEPRRGTLGAVLPSASGCAFTSWLLQLESTSSSDPIRPTLRARLTQRGPSPRRRACGALAQA